MELVAQDSWVIPKGGKTFQTEQEKEAKKDDSFQDAPFPDQAPPSDPTDDLPF